MSARWVLAACAALACAAPSAATAATSSGADALLQAAVDRGSGGTFGYQLRPVGGDATLDRRADHVFDPASALKALIHLYGMRALQSGEQGLDDPVTRYSYPHSRNSGGDPDNPNLCPDRADETPANASATTVAAAHEGMMTVSDNVLTRALELRYGNDAINALAGQLGMADTRLDQILGCGFDGGVRNATSLRDLSVLYASVADGTALSGPARRRFYGLMLRNEELIRPVVADEAAKLGVGAAAELFLERARLRFKGGSYTICEASCAPNLAIDSLAGLVELPRRDARGRVASAGTHTWGSFVDGVEIDCLPCPARDALGEAVVASVGEVVRPAVRSALRTWARRLRLRAFVSVARIASEPAGAYVVAGALRRPAAVAVGEACRGVVRIVVRRGSQVLRREKLRLGASCSFASRLDLPAARGPLSVVARFGGNRRVLPAVARSR